MCIAVGFALLFWIWTVVTSATDAGDVRPYLFVWCPAVLLGLVASGVLVARIQRRLRKRPRPMAGWIALAAAFGELTAALVIGTRLPW